MRESIDALFGGKRLSLQIPRARLVSFETALGLDGSAFGLLQRFAAGAWSVRDVVLTIAHAHPDGWVRARSAVEAVVTGPIGPAVYAVLAARLLEAALFGLPDDAAVFDETNPQGGSA